MYNRIDLSYLCSFILSGSRPIPQAEPESIEKADAIAYQVLKDLSEGKTTYLKAEAALNMAFGTHQQVYMEAGMKLGARLVLQLLEFQKT